MSGEETERNLEHLDEEVEAGAEAEVFKVPEVRIPESNASDSVDQGLEETQQDVPESGETLIVGTDVDTKPLDKQAAQDQMIKLAAEGNLSEEKVRELTRRGYTGLPDQGATQISSSAEETQQHKPNS